MHRHRSNNSKSIKGITLIEVAISFIILATGILTVISVFPHITNFGQNTQNIYIATIYAQEKLDEIVQKNQPISTNPSSEKSSNLPDCERKWWGEEPKESLQKVFVLVSWSFNEQKKSIMISGLMGPLSLKKKKERT